jgi:hypothetical protein
MVLIQESRREIIKDDLNYLNQNTRRQGEGGTLTTGADIINHVTLPKDTPYDLPSRSRLVQVQVCSFGATCAEVFFPLISFVEIGGIRGGAIRACAPRARPAYRAALCWAVRTDWTDHVKHSSLSKQGRRLADIILTKSMQQCRLRQIRLRQ